MLEVFRLFGTIRVDTKEAEGALEGVEAKGKQAAGALPEAFSAVGGRILNAAGFASVTAAVLGIGRSGIRAAAEMERGMREVFTLLPGLSAQARDQMTADVQQVAAEMGVLPNEVIPALYQAISAGVPPDNVFEFLRVANQAAVGGVSDLTTAVDGLTSVVNAYGADAISATEASDLMFTAVRLGKTDFNQLSQSLFNVIPTASALGVEFGDVTAALAAMTAQGVPTSVATTQLRQMLVELSKEGSKTSDTFQRIAGKSFKQFVAEGGSVQGALQLLERHAQQTGVGVNDLFGSVEAGAAALTLTGKGTDAFTNALDEMGNSAGATEEAFGTMSESLDFAWKRIRAGTSVIITQFGEFLMPAVRLVVGWFGRLIDAIVEMDPLARNLGITMIGLASGITAVKVAMTAMQGAFGPLATTIRGIGAAIRGAFLPLTVIAGIVTAFTIAYKTNFLGIGDITRRVVGWIGERLQTVSLFFRAVIGNLDTLGWAWKEIFTSIGYILEGFGLILYGLLVEPFVNVYESIVASLRGTAEAIGGWVNQVADFFQPVVNFLNSLGIEVGNGIRRIAEGAMSGLDRLIGQARDTITETAQSVLENNETVARGYDQIQRELGNIVTVYTGAKTVIVASMNEMREAAEDQAAAVTDSNEAAEAAAATYSGPLPEALDTASGSLGGLEGAASGAADAMDRLAQSGATLAERYASSASYWLRQLLGDVDNAYDAWVRLGQLGVSLTPELQAMVEGLFPGSSISDSPRAQAKAANREALDGYQASLEELAQSGRELSQEQKAARDGLNAWLGVLAQNAENERQAAAIRADTAAAEASAAEDERQARLEAWRARMDENAALQGQAAVIAADTAAAQAAVRERERNAQNLRGYTDTLAALSALGSSTLTEQRAQQAAVEANRRALDEYTAALDELARQGREQTAKNRRDRQDAAILGVLGRATERGSSGSEGAETGTAPPGRAAAQGGLPKEVKSFWQRALGFVGDGLSKLGQGFLNLAAKNIPVVGAALDGFAAGPIAGVVSVITSLLGESEAFKTLMEQINAALQPLIERVVLPLVEALTKLLDAVWPIIEVALQLVQVGLQPLVWLLENVVAPVLSAVAHVVAGVWNAIASALNWALGWLGVNLPMIDPDGGMSRGGTAAKPGKPADTGSSPGGATSRTGGNQISQITGPTRDLLISVLSPLVSLDTLVGIGNRIYNLLDQRLPRFDNLGNLAPAGGAPISFEAGAIQINPPSGDPRLIGEGVLRSIEERLAERISFGRRARG